MRAFAEREREPDRPGKVSVDSELRDRLEIVETCTRMAWYTDRREWDRLEDVFASQVEVDYTSLNRGEPATIPRAELIAGWRSVLGGLRATQHLTGNHLVSLEEDSATCTATFQATHLSEDPHGGPRWTLGGDYLFALERAEGGWRINSVTMIAKWGSGNRHLVRLAAGDSE